MRTSRVILLLGGALGAGYVDYRAREMRGVPYFKAVVQLFTGKQAAAPIEQVAKTWENTAHKEILERNKGDIKLLFTKDDDEEGAERRKRMEALVRRAQDIICQHAERIDGGKFLEERHSQNTPQRYGGGITRVLEDSNVYCKAAVNVSVFYGDAPISRLEMLIPHHKSVKKLFSEKRLPDKVKSYSAAISLILHPWNPNVPTVHANYRYFEWRLPDGRRLWWFGGGSDLTPTYVDEDDAKFFHRVLKEVCDQYDQSYYGRFKKWCDQYFFNTFRKEARGIGGIFFDDLDSSEPLSEEQLEKFVQHLADTFPKSYFPIVERHKDQAYSKRELHFQQLRRGRYVEFNLMFDRGTKWGLAMPNPRVQSILASLPLTARWEYDYKPEPGSPEEATMKILKEPKEWV